MKGNKDPATILFRMNRDMMRMIVFFDICVCVRHFSARKELLARRLIQQGSLGNDIRSGAARRRASSSMKELLVKRLLLVTTTIIAKVYKRLFLFVLASFKHLYLWVLK